MRLAMIGLVTLLVAACGGSAISSPSVVSEPSAASTTEPTTASAVPTASLSPSPWDEADRQRACWAYSMMAEVADRTDRVEVALADGYRDTAETAATLLHPQAEELFLNLDGGRLGESARPAWRKLWAASYNLLRYSTLVKEGIAEDNERKLAAARVVLQRGMSQVASAANERVGLEVNQHFGCADSGYPRAELPEPPVFLQLGTTGVVYTDNLRLRSNPWVGTQSAKYTPTLDAGTMFTVLDGPTYGSGYWWYRVRLRFMALDGGVTEGWVASASRDGCEWVDIEGAYDPGCPEGVM